MTLTTSPTGTAGLKLRLPVAPLFALIAVRLDRPICINGTASCEGCNTGQHAGPVAIANEIGFCPSTPLAWWRRGDLPLDSADRAAVALGYHPSEVWGDAYWQACDSLVGTDSDGVLW